MSTENIGITFIQERYIYQNRPKGISKGYRTYINGEGKSRAAIIISCDTLDAILVTQFSDNDTVLLEIHKGSKTFYAASVYMEHNERIDNKLQRLEQILEFTKGAKLILGTDSNAGSTTWHDTTTNNRGKMMEDFIASNQLHIVNEESPRRTFQSSRGRSNVDLTILNNQMLADVTGWQISEEESASDHNIITFSINLKADTCNEGNYPEIK
jgi:hypothetical protein